MSPEANTKFCFVCFQLCLIKHSKVSMSQNHLTQYRKGCLVLALFNTGAENYIGLILRSMNESIWVLA
jgi:hypothetical protein